MESKTLQEISNILSETLKEYREVIFQIKQLKELSAFELTDIDERLNKLENKKSFLEGKIEAFNQAKNIIKLNSGRKSRQGENDE